ncbi:unnamed protein product [Symbiodinium necroappetens]|uniref:Uncharacterized protein n=1 Tax=Symbiodinium necroappetens TaxID=1628268 RepID=A0A813B5E1_9DINO|nr:unnamed protein product [Symbiodinium necroappetens]
MTQELREFLKTAVAGKLKAKEFPGLCLSDQVLQEYSLSSFCPGAARELSCDPAQVADCRLHWHGSYKVQWEFTPMPSSGQSLESIATELMTSSAMPCLSWRPFNQNQAQALSFVLQQVDGLWRMLFKRSNLSTTKYLLEVRNREKGYLVYKHVKVQDAFLCKPIRVIRFQLVVEVSNAESCRLRVELSSQAPFEFCTAADPHCRVMCFNNDQKVAYLHDSAVAMARDLHGK